MQIKFNPFSFTDRFNQSLEVWWNNAAGGLRQTGEGVPVMGGRENIACQIKNLYFPNDPLNFMKGPSVTYGLQLE